MSTSKKNDFDIGKNKPPKQEGAVYEGPRYSCFGYSLQGASHVEMNVPCQDFNDFKYIEGADIIVAAIADGVGSCPLSHWGSCTAVRAAIDYTEKEIRKLYRGKKLKLTEYPEIPAILGSAFSYASNFVEDFAEQQNRPVSAFMSTLTLALYDGDNLYCQHVGDDGVVAQFKDGSVEMVTQRIKGEEASSVYPLQSGKKFWQFSKTDADKRGPVVAFVMATDGVLDAFVMSNDAYANVEGCCGGIYYPFMERSVYTEDKQHKVSPRRAEEALSYYLSRMKSSEYRRQVTDDLTLLSIINPMEVKRSIRPIFDKKVFNDVTGEIRRKQERMLYPQKKITSKNDQSQSVDVSVHQETNHKSDSRNDRKVDGFKHEEDAAIMESVEVNWKIIAGSFVILATGFIFGFLLGIFFSGRKKDVDNVQPPSISANSAHPEIPNNVVDDGIKEEIMPKEQSQEKNTEKEESPLQDDAQLPTVSENSTQPEETYNMMDDTREEEYGTDELPQENIEAEESSWEDETEAEESPVSEIDTD